MKNKAVFYIINSSFLLSVLMLNFIYLDLIGGGTELIGFILCTIIIIFWVVFDYILSYILYKRLDILNILIMVLSILPFTFGSEALVIFMLLPNVAIVGVFIWKFFRIHNRPMINQHSAKLSYIRSFYLLSFIMIVLILIIKSIFIYLLIPIGFLYATSVYILMSNYKSIEKNYYVFVLAIISLILFFLSTHIEESIYVSYNILFSFTYTFIALLSLTHLIPILKMTKVELLLSTKKMKKKIKSKT